MSLLKKVHFALYFVNLIIAFSTHHDHNHFSLHPHPYLNVFCYSAGFVQNVFYLAKYLNIL